MLDIYFLSALILGAAMLYSSVGHAGASGYLAAMALCSVAPAVMKPTALTLNILVATMATIQFYRAGCFSLSLFWPFAAASVPLAFLGGAVTLPGKLYKPIVGAVLLFAAYRLFKTPRVDAAAAAIKPVPLQAALASGVGIGSSRG